MKPLCQSCSSFRTSHRWSVAGRCLMTGKSTLPTDGPMIIGPSAYFQNRRLYVGPIITCYTPGAADEGGDLCLELFSSESSGSVCNTRTLSHG